MRVAWPAVVLALLAAGCSGAGGTDANSGTDATAPTTGVASVVRKVQTSVVTVVVEDGEGSGVIWNGDGTIVTNDHVIHGAKHVQVLLASGRRVRAHVQATDRLSDLAVVKVDGTGLPAATFVDRLPQVGDQAVAVGSPFGFDRTVSAGIVSGLHRSLPTEKAKLSPLVDLIQTDAAISPGNSGGALVNARGDVIGVNVAYLPPKTGAVEIGFAIPSGTVRDVVQKLLRGQRVGHPFLGVRPTELWPEIVDRYHIHARAGVLVYDVVRGSPADEAGVATGDVVTRINGKSTPTIDAYLATLRHLRPGQRVRLSLTGLNANRTVTATVADQAKVAAP